MKANKEKAPAYYLFTGLAFLLLGLGNVTLFINPKSNYEILFAIVGIPLVLGATIILQQYKRVKNVSDR